jgi:flagellar biosynthesis protein FliP
MLTRTMVILSSEDAISRAVQKQETKQVSQGLSTSDNFLQLIGLVLLLVIILVAAYYTTKYVGGIKMGQMKNSNFRVIDSYQVSPNKVLQIVKIGNKFVVIAIGKDTINYITELDESEVLIKETGTGEKLNFKQILDKMRNRNEERLVAMNTHDKKLENRKSAIIVVLLTACILTLFFFSATTASAATVGNTITAGNTNTAGRNNDTTAADTAANGTNVGGTIGPLQFSLNTDKDGNNLSSSLQMLLVLTIISLAPSILIMVTSFTRIIIILHFVRSAIGTQTTPPNQVLIGLALFLTFFIMSPVLSQINTDAVKPLSEGKITQEEAFKAGVAPIRTFMLDQIQTDTKDLRLFIDIAKITKVETRDDIPTSVIIPAFIISELRKAFIIGFLIYIPFIVIDMVVASTLMSMGMMMLPPTMISMPFKILLFIMADGWNLIIGEIVKTFY